MPPLEFYPPERNQAFVNFCQRFAPLAGQWRYRLTLDIDPADLEQLLALQNSRQLLLPNHPTYQDGMALFLLSAELGQRFYYLVAQEAFRGLQRWFLPKIGAYSIRRGLGDRASIAQTLKLLAEPDCRLVIFPEGGCSFQNDTVMPFRPGGVQLALQSLNRWAKQGQALPDLYAVPIALKYFYTDDPLPIVETTLRGLEQRLQVPVQTRNWYERLRAVAEQVLVRLEQEYQVHTAEVAAMDWNQRIARLKTLILQRCEQELGLEPAPHEPVRERVYQIQYLLETEAQPLKANSTWTPTAIHKATVRLLNFDAIYDGYVAAHPTPERFLDTLIRLEREVFAIEQPPPKGHRRVVLRVGQPLNLKDHFPAYRRQRGETAAQLTTELQQRVQELLDKLNTGGGAAARPTG